jgi:glyoxylase-like metal-dependent hydrolase (beta-lactamase superfamily II)
MGPNGGRLFANLAAIGLTPADIDAVVISHTHPDHVGNLRAADGGRAFPSATIFAPRADWDFLARGEPDLSYMPVPEMSAAASPPPSSAAPSRWRPA